jgi:hypothetical protein
MRAIAKQSHPALVSPKVISRQPTDSACHENCPFDQNAEQSFDLPHCNEMT